MQKAKSKFSMFIMLLMVGLIPLTVGLLVTAIDSSIQVKNEMEEAIESKLTATANYAAEYFGCDWTTWMENGIEEDDERYVDTGVPDGVEVTIFKAEPDGQVLRYLSSIKDSSGQRVSGTPAADEITEAVYKNGKTYHGDGVVINGKTYKVCYAPIKDENGTIVGMSFAGEQDAKIDNAVAKVTRGIIIIALVVFAIFTGIILYVGKIVSAPLQSIAKSTNRLADGYINEPIVAKSILTETNMIIDAANQLQTNLQTIVKEIKNTSTDLSYSVKDTKGLCNEASNGSNLVDAAVGELAITASTVAESVQSLNENILTIGNNIETISGAVEQLNTSSAAINQISNEATTDISDVYRSSEEAVTAVADIADHMEKLNAAIARVTEATDMIGNIADQTSLLSLNASIEAARAGEMGKGFAVVAGEIGNLAQTSAESVAQINDIVKDVINMSNQSAQVTEQVKQIIAGEQDKVNKTQKSFLKLKGYIDESLKQISQIADDTESLAKAKESAVGAVDDLSAISEENAASCEESSASVSNIASSIADINDRSDAMENMAGNLTKAIEAFKD